MDRIADFRNIVHRIWRKLPPEARRLMEREDNAKETLTTFVNKIVEKAAEINQLKSEILELEKSKETQAVPPPVATNKTATYAQITLDKSQATKASAPKNKVKALDICRNTRANTRFVVDVPADKTVANTKTDLWQTIKRKLPNPRAKTLVSGKTLIIIPDDSKTLEKLRSVPNLKTIGPKQPRIIIYDIDNDLGEEELADGLLLQNTELDLMQDIQKHNTM